MSCSDCIHIEPCYRHPIEELTNEANGIYEPNAEKWCKWFEDKSKIVELPCKVEDTIYFVSENILEIAKGKIKEIIINKHNNKIMNVDFGYMCKQFDIEYVGKTVFLTKEQAEAMLKELQND